MTVSTYKFRLRDKHRTDLDRQARAVNLVWNFCNETQMKAVRGLRPWLSAIDLMRLTAGSSHLVGLHAHTIQRVCRQYHDSRRQHRRPWLRWRGKRSLGWVPFNTGHVAFNGTTFRFNGADYEPMHLRDMPLGRFGAGQFTRDSKGRWYISVPVDAAEVAVTPAARVGIDLGLKHLATLSTGQQIEAPRFYRRSEAALATAQRAGKTKRSRAIATKVANRRKDFLHKTSKAIADEFGLIVIGDVSPKAIARSRFAKSSLDAGWATLKHMLSYKAIARGGMLLEVPEAYTTQSCSACGSLPPSRPKGIAGLGIREWVCSDCGASHDRDTNAARNILRMGLHTLAGGIHV